MRSPAARAGRWLRERLPLAPAADFLAHKTVPMHRFSVVYYFGGMTLFFFLVLTPYALFVRLIGKAPLDLSWKDGRKTFWIDKKQAEPDIERYRRAY